MKKGLLIAALTLCLTTAKAYDYPFLVFVNTSGDTTALSVSNLTLTVSGTSLSVTNNDGTVSFALTDLVSMQFSTDDGQLAESLEKVLNADAPVQVYTLEGLPLGRFDNLLQAVGRLEKGLYVVSDGKNAQKILVQ